MSLMGTLRRRRSETPSTVADATLPERLVARTAAILGGTHSRRRFLARTAVIGSALATDPLGYVFKPGTAYGAVCGTCGDGWTAFCCTINGGRNSCPPGSFVAGWWKADNAAYCCGQARYIIDCNASCPTSCSCRCSGASCDGRRTCCNQFRYGGCNQQIRCYGPVVCRVAICIPPWVYSSGCTTSGATDNRTVQHGSSCLSAECDSSVTRKYYALGGPRSFLGIRTQAERSTPNGAGRYAAYQGGRIYSSAATGAWSIYGSLFVAWVASGGTSGRLGFPTTDVRAVGDGAGRYSRFQGGHIYTYYGGAFAVTQPFNNKHLEKGGATGIFKYPRGEATATRDRRAVYQDFQGGRVFYREGTVVAVHNPVYSKHIRLGSISGPLGYPAADPGYIGDGRGRACLFERGVIYYTPTTPACGLWGLCLQGYLNYGGPGASSGYPTTDVGPVGDGRGVTARLERGQIYATSTTGGHVVGGFIHIAYVQRGGPTGRMGYPTSDVIRDGSFRHVDFEQGRLTLDIRSNQVSES